MSDLILTGRRNFLVRAIGLAALPVAATIPAVAMPTISLDLVRRMQAWKAASDEYHAVCRALNEGKFRLSEPGGGMTPEADNYYNSQTAEHCARWALLNEIAKT